jgi:hypothetical protein
MKTREYIYPNPTVRAKMFTDSGISKLGVSISLQWFSQHMGFTGIKMPKNILYNVCNKKFSIG